MTSLKTFVLDYLEQVGSIVEPAAYGVHELLLPEQIAQRWQTDAYQQITFNDANYKEANRLSYNHPLVEQMVEEARAQTASTRAYVNGLRLHKDGLESLAAKSWVVLNGRTMPQHQATVARVRSSYVRFNFKAAILSDEKQERLVSVLMDVHTGERVAAAEEIEAQANAHQPDEVLRSLKDAPIRWQPANGPPLEGPLEQATLAALLERARLAVLKEMKDFLDGLQKRVDRFRQLDEARLKEYYDELERDLKHRLQSVSPDRRAGLADKLTAVTNERASKLADVAERYQVRLDLTLLNLLVIQQPKLIVPINIENRTTQTSAYAVWDPLLHQLEPLTCHVCGAASQRTYLCFNGHLAHEDCLAPACIDCKRVFCQACSHEVGQCAVCCQPLCNHSRIVCHTCGRGTCQAHTDLCHANDGAPVDLKAGNGKATKEKPKPLPPPPPPAKPEPRGHKPTPSKSAPKSKTPPLKPAWPKGVPRPLFIEVVSFPDAIMAYVFGKRDREIAVRTWELKPREGGIIRTCECEKGSRCRANNMVLRPSDRSPVQAQMRQEIADLCREYDLSLKKVKYNQLSRLSNEIIPTSKFKLMGLWLDEKALAMGRETFEQMYWK